MFKRINKLRLENEWLKGRNEQLHKSNTYLLEELSKLKKKNYKFIFEIYTDDSCKHYDEMSLVVPTDCPDEVMEGIAFKIQNSKSKHCCVIFSGDEAINVDAELFRRCYYKLEE